MPKEIIHQVFGARVLILQDLSEKQTETGIHLTSQTPLDTGTIAFAGDQSKFRAGLRVFFYPVEALPVNAPGLGSLILLADEAIVATLIPDERISEGDITVSRQTPDTNLG